jgi:ABC-type phosphate/phosphonate transport system substrate-binding protein
MATNTYTDKTHVALVRIVGFLFCFSIAGYTKADLILSAPPRENAEVGEKIYGPLAEHLTTLLGERVVYKHPDNWLEYQRDLRHDVYDIVFDGPHFVSWRMEHLRHDVLVKLPGYLEFVIVTREDDEQIQKISDLIGKKICAIPPPNLATLTVIEQFPNPVRQPIIWGVPGGFMQVFHTFNAKQCRAAVFRSNFYDRKLTPIDKRGYKILFRSKPLPNQAISVSSRLSDEHKKKIIRSLTVGDGKKATASISKRFSSNEAFIAAQQDEYVPHNDLLEGIVFGW